nr:MAG: ORF1 [TTV-like mini virus]
MPYYRRRRWNWNPYTRWRRRYWRRRPRKTFRRRHFRRRRHQRVRRKFTYLKLKDWQPKTIRKCCIKGMHPLFLASAGTISRNYRMYEHSFTPPNWPTGGGFSVTKYNLDGLFEQHSLNRNWWTASNQTLPLVRYLGCKLKFYQSWSADYVVNWYNHYPMTATHLLYESCQPSLMMMNKNKLIVPSKLTQHRRRPYVTLRLPPPSQMSNRWFFARDLAKVGLAMITVSCCSLDNYYIGSHQQSNNISFISLNSYFWQKHNFQQPSITGYSPYTSGTIEKHIWFTQETTQVDKLKPTNFILLGTTKENQQGQLINEQNKNTYFTNHKLWGNPFRHEYFTGASKLYVSTKSWTEITAKMTQTNETIGAGILTEPSNPLTNICRYAPDRDTGQGNKIYLKSTIRDESGWEPPTDEELIAEGFPIWILAFGFLDWHKKLGTATNLDRSWVVVIESDFISPKLPYYIPLDQYFYEGVSPYEKPDDGHINDEDEKNWFPCTKYQQETLNNLASCGPGIYRFGDRKSIEGKLKYNFYFKFGGCAPKMDTIRDPTKQEVYPIPNCQHSTYSLQNPSMPPESLLWQFDVYKDILTSKAAARIRKDFSSKKTVFTDQSAMQPTASATAESDSSEETPDSEEETTTLLLKYKQQRRKRKWLEQQLQQLAYQP